MTSGNELERNSRLQMPQHLVEGPGVPEAAAVSGADANPELRDRCSGRHRRHLVVRGVRQLEPQAAAERAYAHVPQLICRRLEVTAQHPREAEAARVLQAEVRRAEPAFRVAGDAPRRTRGRHAQDTGDVPRQVPGQVGRVLRTADLVQALQRDAAPAGGIRHDQHGRLREAGTDQAPEHDVDAQYRDPVLRSAGEAVRIRNATCLATARHHVRAPKTSTSSTKTNVLCGSSNWPPSRSAWSRKHQPAIRLAGDRFRKGSRQVRMSEPDPRTRGCPVDSLEVVSIFFRSAKELEPMAAIETHAAGAAAVAGNAWPAGFCRGIQGKATRQ